MRRIKSCLAVATIIFISSASADPIGDSQVAQIAADYWEVYIEANPTRATELGVKDFNDRLPSATTESLLEVAEAYRSLLRRLRDVSPDALSVDDRTNVDLLTWVLEEKISDVEQDKARIPFNTFSGFYMRSINASRDVAMESVEDYEDYLARMREIPRYFTENIANMRRGSVQGFVLPQIVIDGIVPTLEAQVKEAADDSSFYEHFKSMSSKVSPAEQERIRREGKMIIETMVMPAFADLAEFLTSEYKASEFLAAERLPDGEAYYASQIKRYTTLTDATADEIHATGLAEVRRIRAEMQAIVDELEFDGDLEAFTEFLLSDPQFYATTPEELLQKTAYVAKRADYVMPAYFGKLPRQSYGIVPVPDEIAPNYPTGAYSGSPKGAKNGGTYWVNTFALDQRPLYEIPALTLHEGVPGHHHQNALADENESSFEFRRSLGFSAFGEGWGLYSEKLGVEMGMYTTPYEHFGRLSYEMWRACRLVIDTGIHSQDWTRQQSIDYLMANTALTYTNARSEVDRYISWPGQALAYKLGELKIWELRHRAEKTLGNDFDLREFHDAVLGQGALPLSLLDEVITRYIDDALSAAAEQPAS
jgi:uncharacterized protein (DUF885 family)